MKFQTLADFGLNGGTVQSGTYVAAAIACSSEMDICQVGSHRLAPMSIVPCEAGQRIDPVRGYRTGSTTSLGAGPPRASSSLVLMLYEPGDPLIAPGPRAPIIKAQRVASIGTTAPTATLVFRLPFFGRSQAAIYCSRIDTDTTDANLIIRGVRYLTATERAADATPDQGYITEVLKTLWEGTGAQPVSTITATDKARGAIYIGGQGDLQESFDELEVWAWHGTATPGLNMQAEVFGERGR